MYGIFAAFFSLLQQLCAVGHVIFNMAYVNTFLLELTTAYLAKQIF